jgi:L,D-transpeptidase catalytic domain
MRSAHVLSAAFAALLPVAFAAPAAADIAVHIDKSTQTMTVAVDGAQRYVWPVSTGRPGYDTPNGTFRPNRMDADHLSQEWDNAPMPHAIFFDMNGHAIHGFFDIKHLGSPVSHGCVRISPDHATTLFNLVSAEGMKETTVVVSGRTPTGRMPEVARRQAAPGAPEDAAGQPMQIAPGYPQQAPASYALGPQPGYALPPQQGYALGPQAGYALPPQQGYAQVQPGYPPPPPAYGAQSYYRQAQQYDGRQAYRQPPQPQPPQQFFLFQQGD